MRATPSGVALIVLVFVMKKPLSSELANLILRRAFWLPIMLVWSLIGYSSGTAPESHRSCYPIKLYLAIKHLRAHQF